MGKRAAVFSYLERREALTLKNLIGLRSDDHKLKRLELLDGHLNAMK